MQEQGTINPAGFHVLKLTSAETGQTPHHYCIHWAVFTHMHIFIDILYTLGCIHTNFSIARNPTVQYGTHIAGN